LIEGIFSSFGFRQPKTVGEWRSVARLLFPEEEERLGSSGIARMEAI
jgi:hypothetical protein